jgi:cell division protein FtsB
LRRSRLNLFKATSMTISLLGIIMVLITIGIGGYLIFTAISSTISADVGGGVSYDKVATLKSEYNSLSSQYAQTKLNIENMNNKNATAAYDKAELELIRAQSDISDADSAITSKKSSDEINNRIELAQKQLEVASQALKDLQAQFS